MKRLATVLVAAVVTPVTFTNAAAPATLTPLSWDEAHQRAASIVKQMTLSEQEQLLIGIGWKKGVLSKWWYVGNTAAVPRLNIPSLNMQDAAGGFRTYWSELVGTVTCWPSLLSMAASWDVAMMSRFAEALGAEFAAKGANVILGPSINVHRVARNGRNFEYLSGESPYLGARLTERYVHGVQSNGIMSVAKHFAFNNQETDRTTEVSIVDAKTRWEVYYPNQPTYMHAYVHAYVHAYIRVPISGRSTTRHSRPQSMLAYLLSCAPTTVRRRTTVQPLRGRAKTRRRSIAT